MEADVSMRRPLQTRQAHEATAVPNLELLL